MANTATELVVIGRGRLITQCGTAEFVENATESAVRVRTPDPARLREALTGLGMTVTVTDEALRVVGGKIELIGETAAEHGVVLQELSPQQGSLEQAFMQTTGQDVQFHARPAPERPALGKVGPS